MKMIVDNVLVLFHVSHVMQCPMQFQQTRGLQNSRYPINRYRMEHPISIDWISTRRRYSLHSDTSKCLSRRVQNCLSGLSLAGTVEFLFFPLFEGTSREEEDAKTIGDLSFVIDLSFHRVTGNQNTGYRVNLNCHPAFSHGSCGEKQSAPCRMKNRRLWNNSITCVARSVGV